MAYFIFLGFTTSVLFCILIFGLYKIFTFQVDEESEIFVLNCGKVTKRFTQSGLKLCFEKALPWVKIVRVSKQIDYRNFRNIQVNDRYGTTVAIDLWIEFRILDPYRALFRVEDWEESLSGLITHSTTSLISSQTVAEILSQRAELSEILQKSVARDIERWGIQLSSAMIQHVGLLPEVSSQFFTAIAAKIERTKALVEEEGRLKVARIEADTSVKVAELIGLSKMQGPLEIGKVYSELSHQSNLISEFKKYWELIHIDPRKTVAFKGFDKNAFNQLEALQTVESSLSHLNLNN